jgi:AraC-like DNA-binding protein
VRKSYMIHINDTNDFSYISSGLFTTSEKWIHAKRQIDSYELIYVVYGELFLQEENEKFHLRQGDILLLFPHRTHLSYYESTGKTSFYWSHFTTDLFNGLHINWQHVTSPDHFKIASLFKQLLHIANTPDYPRYSSDLMMLLILNEVTVLNTAAQNKNSKLIKEISEWIRIHNARKITVDTTAVYFGYNADYLSLLFKKEMGIGLKQYINKEKMQCAKNLLLSSNYSIKQIADTMGFDDENQFTKYFKYHESQSPIKFRNMYYNTHWNNK